MRLIRDCLRLGTSAQVVIVESLDLFSNFKLWRLEHGINQASFLTLDVHIQL